MNTPNKLTVFRAVMVPFFLATLLIEQIPARFLISGLVFAALSITDAIDGKWLEAEDLLQTSVSF